MIDAYNTFDPNHLPSVRPGCKSNRIARKADGVAGGVVGTNHGSTEAGSVVAPAGS